MSVCITETNFNSVCKPFREKGNYVPIAESTAMMQVKGSYLFEDHYRQFLKIQSVFSRRVRTDNETSCSLVVKLPFL